MFRLFGIAVAGLFAGFIGSALAHDLGGHKLGAMEAAIATQLAATAPNSVTVDNFAFSPATITVAPGTKVTWTNRDDEPHTVVSAEDPKRFKSGPLDTGDSFSFVFDKPGTYEYFCSIHPHMTGTVVVK